MLANRDAATEYIKRAKKALAAGELDQAKKYASKSAELFPSPAATALLQTIATAQTGGGRKQAAGPTSGRTASSTTGTRSANTNAKPAEDARKPTPDQSNIVRKVLQTKNLYERLGIDAKADEKSISKAYKKLSIKVHPDRNPDPRSGDAMIAINKAHDILSDETKRRYYDQTGDEEPNTPGAAGHPFARAGGFGGGQIDPEDFVNMFFGQGMRAPGGFRFQTNFGGGMHQRQRRAHHPRAGRHHHQQAPQEDPNLGGNGGGGGFLYLFLIVMSAQMLFNSGGGTESYSLKRTQEFSQPVGMHSRYLDYVEMTYYMRPGDAAKIKSNKADIRRIKVAIEEQVEAGFWDKQRRSCRQSRHRSSKSCLLVQELEDAQWEIHTTGSLSGAEQRRDKAQAQKDQNAQQHQQQQRRNDQDSRHQQPTPSTPE